VPSSAGEGESKGKSFFKESFSKERGGNSGIHAITNRLKNAAMVKRDLVQPSRASCGKPGPTENNINRMAVFNKKTRESP